MAKSLTEPGARRGPRMHQNPNDEGVVYLEGFPDSQIPHILSAEDGRRITLAHRVIVGTAEPKTTTPRTITAAKHMSKLRRIMKLEHELCGQEDW